MCLLGSDIGRIQPVSDFALLTNGTLGLLGPGGRWSRTLRGGLRSHRSAWGVVGSWASAGS